MTSPLRHHGLRPWAITLLLSLAAACAGLVGGNARADTFAEGASFGSRADPWRDAWSDPGTPYGDSFASAIAHGGRTAWWGQAGDGAWPAASWNRWPARAGGLYERDRTGVNARTQFIGQADNAAASVAAAVPEPETWAMMLIGLVASWSVTRRRKGATRFTESDRPRGSQRP